MTKLDDGSVILYKAIRKALPKETRSKRSTSDTEHSKGKGPAAEAPAVSEEASKWPVRPESSPTQSMGGGAGRSSSVIYSYNDLLISLTVFTIKHIQNLQKHYNKDKGHKMERTDCARNLDSSR